MALGDIHAQRESFLEILRALGIVGESLSWQAEDTRLVMLGDVCDRGYDSKSIYALLMKYQKDAPRFGSEVRFIIGNHEVMNMFGLSRYTRAEEYGSYREDETSDGRHEFEKAFSAGGWLHDWLLGQHIILKVGPLIFAHGDLPVSFANTTVENIETATKRALREVLRQGRFSMLPDILFSEQTSILWCRQAQLYKAPAYGAALSNFLERNNAKLYICGHTPSEDGKFHLLYDKQYLCIDSAMTFEHQGIGRKSALLVEQGRARALYFTRSGIKETDLGVSL